MEVFTNREISNLRNTSKNDPERGRSKNSQERSDNAPCDDAEKVGCR